MRILVTGGAGFIGSHCVRTLLRGGFAGTAPAQVTVLDKLTYAGNLANLEPVAGDARYAFVRGGIGTRRCWRGSSPGTSFADGLTATIRWYPSLSNSCETRGA